MKSVFFLCVLVLLVISCGPPPQTGQFPYVPETGTVSEPESVEPERNLPPSAMVDLRKMPYLRNAFKTFPPIGRGGIDDIYGTTRGKVDNIAIVSGGSLDILKAFIAKGWAPVVIIQFKNRKPEFVPVVRYDDRASEIILQNPNNFSERRVSYTDFEMSWRRGGRSKCALVTPQRLTEAKAQEVLGTYLPSKAFADISVRSR